MKIAHLVHVVIAIGLVQQAAIVPDDQIAGPPLVPVLLLWLGQMVEQLGEECKSFLFRHSNDAFDRLVHRVFQPVSIGRAGSAAHSLIDAS